MTTSNKDPFPILYPVIDCFNHRFGEKVSWNIDHGTFSLVLAESVANGRQVFNNYAPKSNEELLLGYGFCLANNPCDQVAVRLSKPPPPIHDALKSRMPLHFKSNEWTTEESGFYIRGRAHYAGGYPNPFGLPCLRGVPAELVLALQTIVSFVFTSENKDEKTQKLELWWATLDSILDRLQQKREAICAWNGRLPEAPENSAQHFAKMYRDGQLTILNEVIAELNELLGPLERGQKDLGQTFALLTPQV